MNILFKITSFLVKGKALIQIVQVFAELIDRLIEPIEDFSKKIDELKSDNSITEERKQ